MNDNKRITFNKSVFDTLMLSGDPEYMAAKKAVDLVFGDKNSRIKLYLVAATLSKIESLERLKTMSDQIEGRVFKDITKLDDDDAVALFKILLGLQDSHLTDIKDFLQIINTVGENAQDPTRVAPQDKNK